jgi:hypothetical protein
VSLNVEFPLAQKSERQREQRAGNLQRNTVEKKDYVGVPLKLEMPRLRYGASLTGQ